MVRNSSGRPLAGVCVDIDPQDPGPGAVTGTSGRYTIRGIATGRHRLLFSTTNCRFSGVAANYAPQWWRNSATSTLASVIRVRAGARLTGKDAVLGAGGAVSGMVRFRSRSGHRLAGVCVFAAGAGAMSGVFADGRTSRRGTFRLRGLGTGRFSLYFDPACSHPSPGKLPTLRTVRVTDGRTVMVTAVIRPAAVIRGVVTGPDHQPVAGICVLTGRTTPVTTGADGSYRLTGLAAGRYHVGFIGGCGNKGSYAPQVYPGAADLAGGIGVRVRAGQVRRGVDATMRPGATMAGTLRDSDGRPVSDICVDPVQLGGPLVITDLLERMLFAFDSQSGFSESAGAYRIQNMWPDRYDVLFYRCGTQNYAARWFMTRRGVPVPVWAGAGTVTSGVSAVMQPGGIISGAVTQDGRDQDSNACVTAFPHGGSQAFRGLGLTEVFPGQGSYSISGLAPGRYVVEVFACNRGKFGAQWYPDATGPATASPVTVAAGTTTPGIDIAVTKAGSISGQITSAVTRRPLRDVCVQVLDYNADDPENPNFVSQGCTGRAGGYRVGGLGGSGAYDVVLGGYGQAAARVRTGVPVRAPDATTGISAALDRPGSMSGTVTSSPRSVPVSGICVRAIPMTGHGIIGLSQTGPGGGYQMPGLTPGTYKVQFAACTPGPVPGMPGQAPQWYQGRGQSRTAAPVRIRAGQQTTGIGASLAPDGALSGAVTTTGSAPLGGICVTAVPASAAFPGSGPIAAITSPAGRYTIRDIAPGKYKVAFTPGCGATGYATQWWHDAPSQAAAAFLTIRPGATRAGINAALRASP